MKEDSSDQDTSESEDHFEDEDSSESEDHVEDEFSIEELKKFDGIIKKCVYVSVKGMFSRNLTERNW
jgi:hypothetical protein